MPRSDPISVCWLTEGVQREVRPPPHTHTHGAESDLDRKPTDRQTRISHQAFVSSLTTTSSHAHLPPLFTSLDLPSHTKSLSECNRTHTLHTWYQTSAVPPAGSWPGEGQEPPGSGFMRRLLVHALTRSTLPSITAFYSFYFLLFPQFQGFSLF